MTPPPKAAIVSPIMGTNTKQKYKARLSLRHPVTDEAGNVTGYKKSACEVEFTSRRPVSEISYVELLPAAPATAEVLNELLGRHVSTLGLSTRARTVLAAYCIETVEELVALQPYTLLKFKNAGETVLKECVYALESVGLSLGVLPR